MDFWRFFPYPIKCEIIIASFTPRELVSFGRLLSRVRELECVSREIRGLFEENLTWSRIYERMGYKIPMPSNNVSLYSKLISKRKIPAKIPPASFETVWKRSFILKPPADMKTIIFDSSRDYVGICVSAVVRSNNYLLVKSNVEGKNLDILFHKSLRKIVCNVTCERYLAAILETGEGLLLEFFDEDNEEASRAFLISYESLEKGKIEFKREATLLGNENVVLSYCVGYGGLYTDDFLYTFDGRTIKIAPRPEAGRMFEVVSTGTPVDVLIYIINDDENDICSCAYDTISGEFLWKHSGRVIYSEGSFVFVYSGHLNFSSGNLVLDLYTGMVVLKENGLRAFSLNEDDSGYTAWYSRI